MKVTLEPRGPNFIGAVLTTQRGLVVLRRWPWPENAIGREKHLRHAAQYVHQIAWVLACPSEIVQP
jgi:hypothetical protein